MTEPLAPGPAPAGLPSPAPALEARFRAVLQQQMQGLPMVNPALGVEAVGFRPWREHWLGVLITPWFMNLWLMPRVAERWQPIGERETRSYVFPAGVFEFIGGRDVTLGDYQACSLFSPMFEFANPQGARDTARAALDALFDGAQRDRSADFEIAPPAAPAAPAAPADPAPAALSKRDFLFGTRARGDHGP